MPTISLFFGIVVQMYWRDHPPAHIHAFYQGHEGVFAIEDCELIAGRLPPTAAKLVCDWIGERREELIANWERAKQKLPLEAIAGADQP
jgi:hypothetical protein